MPDTQKVDVKEFIRLVGKKYGVPETFYNSIFGIESAGGRPDIQDSPKGAMGPGQLMPATARRLGVNPRDPVQNIMGSMKLQRQLLDKYRSITGDEDKAWILAAAAYNAGEGAVEKHGGVPPYAETQNYVRHLIGQMRKARGQGGAKKQEAQTSTPPQRADGRPAKTPATITTSNKPVVRPSLPSLPTTSTATPSSGLTPPPQQGRTSQIIDAMAVGSGLGPLGVFSEDTRRSFFEGVVSAGGSTLADFGWAGSKPFISPVGWATTKVMSALGQGSKHPLQSLGEQIELGTAQSMASHKAEGSLGRVRQGLARGTGMALVEVPKLIGAGVALKAATLPTLGAISGGRTGGVEGALKGAAMGAVYHYGGQITGKFLGQFGNTLVWIAGPAAEKHFVSGVPLDEAVAESVPMGIFAGAGGSDRAKVVLPDGRLREARVTDIPRIASGRLQLAEPEQVVMWGAVERARARFSQLATQEGGFAKLREGTEEEGEKGRLNRLPKKILPDLVTLGAFHYEAGSRTPEEWMGRMLGELKETPDTISPAVHKQLGEVFERSKTLYNEGTAPTFVSGLKQSLVEGLARRTLGEEEAGAKVLEFAKKAGFLEEARDSGLISELEKEPQKLVKVPDVVKWLNERGVIIDVVTGGAPGSGEPVLHKAGQRAPFTRPGTHGYHEGVIVSNKAGSLYLGPDDYHHMGFRPDQISWYRGNVIGGEGVLDSRYRVIRGEEGSFYVGDERGEVVKGPYDTQQEAHDSIDRLYSPPVRLLEEVQSKRAQLARKKGVTEEPNNAHERLISLEQEWDSLAKRETELQKELNLDAWEAGDEYDRYIPSDDYVGDAQQYNKERQAQLSPDNKTVKELDKVRLQMEQLRSAINELEHETDVGPVPWAPHLTSWYEPAIKAYLRDVAQRAEPDAEGNIRITWTSATEQAERGNLFRVLKSLAAKKNDKGNYDLAAVDHNGRGHQWYNIPPARLEVYVGKSLADSIMGDKGRLNNIGWQEFDVRDAKFGGEWAVPLYGDTLENIQKNWPDRPNLLRFAWRPSGNESTVGQFFEKYAKQWGGTIELSSRKASMDELGRTPFGKTPQMQMDEIFLTMPEKMREVLLRQGQVSYGKRLPDAPKNAIYGLRNRITPEDRAQAARELIAQRHKPVQNLLTGQRVPSPERGEQGGGEGGFFGFGSKKSKLDPRVSTDVEERGRDTAGVGVFFRSPSRWMAGFKDSRVDAIAERLFDAEVREHDYTTEWSRRFNAILHNLSAATFASQGRDKARKVLGRKVDKAALQTTFSEFITLIEKPLTLEDGTLNPDRRSANPLIQRALEEHDALAKDFKDYLIQSYEDRGIHIDNPENWGVTDKGYFRHLFPGEDNVFMNGEYQGTGQSYVDAIKMANDLIEANPQAQVEIRRRPVQFVDPSVRVSTKSFERLVRELTGSINKDGEQIIRAGEIRADLVGSVGKKENVGKFFAAALKREGYEGYLRDYEQVMRAHYFQLARSQELSKLRKDITPMLEELRREGKRGVVEGIERHLDDLWGRPLAYEKAVGGFIRQFPALRERIANPDLGLELAVRKIASIHNLLKLRYNPKAMFVNLLQPLRTLWPYLTNKDMMEVIKRYRDPKWRQDMTELGVMSGAVKLETGGSKVEGFGGREFLKDPFTYVSGHNRALGYTAGVIAAERSGLTGYDAHKMGMRWAAKVEFDNSKWDAPRFLRHSLGQFFGQYKGFLVKDIENTIDVFSKQPGDHGFGSRASRVGKWFLGTAAFGGLRAATSPLAWMGTAAGYSMYLGGAALIKAITGASDKDAKFYSSIAFLGIPAALNLDLSASLTPIDDPPGLTAWEKVGRWATGPSITATYDISRAAGQVVAPSKSEKRPLDERLWNLGTKVSPYVRMVQRGYQLEQSVVHGKPQYFTLDRHKVRLTKPQLALGAIGVPPANQTLYYEEKEATGKSPLSKGPSTSPFGNPNRGFISSPFKPLPTNR